MQRIEQHGPLTCIVSEPEPRAAAPAPVLFFLHGYDEGAPSPIDAALRQHGPLRPGNAVAALSQFLIVAPQLPARGDLWHHCAEAVRRIREHVVQVYHGDRSRAYLTGFSFGGNGVFDLALAEPNTWAALWAVDPTRVPPRDPGCPVWLSFGAVARGATREFTEALRLHEADGLDHDRVYLDEGADHVGSAAAAYRDARIYDWLLARRLPQAGTPPPPG